MDYKKDFTLSSYWEQAYQAHSNVSFSPDRRANSIVKDYSEELDEDLKTLGENKGNYEAKYKDKFSSWLGAKSRCISSMITGPSNFPVRRAEKANNSEHNRYEEWRHWRQKYFKAVNRERTLSPEEDLEILMKKLDAEIILNENIKGWNKSIRRFTRLVKGGMTAEQQKEESARLSRELKEKEMSDYYMKNLLSSLAYSYWNGFGTRGTNIKRLRERAVELKDRIETKTDWEDIEFEGGSITVDDDRVKVFHDDKPEQEIINQLKRNGFRWSRYWGCWSRKHTAQAIRAAKYIVCD